MIRRCATASSVAVHGSDRYKAQLAERVWHEGYRYAKAGVILGELVPETTQQPVLWSDVDRERRAKLWKVVDGLNLNMSLGRGMVALLGAGLKDPAWKLQTSFGSTHLTTRWDELLRAKAE